MKKAKSGSEQYHNYMDFSRDGNHEPNRVRCYDNGGETIDRYTVVFSNQCQYLSMSAAPYHPQGFGQHGEGNIFQWEIDNKETKILFSDLPEDCQHLVLSDYAEIYHLDVSDHPILKEKR